MDEHLPTDEPSSDAFDRRRFIKRAAITGAVAVPLVSSFSMTGVNAAFAQQTNVSGRQQGTGESGGETSPTSDDASTTTTDDGPTTTGGSSTTSTTTSPNQVTTSSTTTLPNQTETTVTTLVPNQP